jgi:hypothetical protein
MNRNIKIHIEKRIIKVASPGPGILVPTSVLPARQKRDAADPPCESVYVISIACRTLYR